MEVLQPEAVEKAGPPSPDDIPATPITDVGETSSLADQSAKVKTMNISEHLASFGLPEPDTHVAGIGEIAPTDTCAEPWVSAGMWPSCWPDYWGAPWHTDFPPEYWYWIGSPASSTAHRTKRKGNALSSNEMLESQAASSGNVTQFHKTVLCSFFPKGRCTKGDACTFAHGSTELELAPDLTKTSLCLNWKKGACPRAASQCPFAHGRHELRAASASAAKEAAPPPARAVSGGSKMGMDILALLNRAPTESNIDNHTQWLQEPETLSVDELLLMKLEARESQESGFDEWNDETFGPGIIDNWDFTQVLPPRDKASPLSHSPLSPPYGLLNDICHGERIHTMSTSSGSDSDMSDSVSQWSAAGSSKIDAAKSQDIDASQRWGKRGHNAPPRSVSPAQIVKFQ
jgi:hypothetical protein